MAYKHGAYGEITSSKVTDAQQTDVVAAYIGTAPINLIRGYAEKDLVNMPVKVANMSDVQSKLGYSAEWDAFTLCEAFAAHFDNSVGNVGPIYVVNVLDPDTHKKAEKTTKELKFTNNRAEFESSDIILDTFAIADKVEGVDYSVEYNFAKGTVVVKLLAAAAAAAVQCSYNTVDASAVEAADIIGQTTEDGQYTGLHAMKLIYQYHNAVLNLLAAPGWAHFPEVYRAMVSTVQKLNGHWDGFVNADIPLVDAEGEKIDTIAKALAWKEDNGYTSEFSKVYWPKVKDGSGRVFCLSAAGQSTMQRVDLSHDGVPFESPSNKEIMATALYFGEGSKNRGFDQETANTLNEKGITTACFWGGRWVLWGPHTAAYTYNGSMDARAIFDVNIRMLEHVTNNFQIDHGIKIDQPLTPQQRDTILNEEREKLDTLTGIGALIGTPSVVFLETANPVSDMMNGDFVWDFNVTNTPPFKSGKARVGYTDEGFAAFFETM
jgi:phage tail sheath protein FI